MLPCGCFAPPWLLWCLAVQAACVQSCRCHALLLWHVAVQSCHLDATPPSVHAGGALHWKPTRANHHPKTFQQTCVSPCSYVWLNQYQSQFLPILGLLGLRMVVGAGEWLLRKLGKEKKSEQARDSGHWGRVLFFSVLRTVLAAKHAGHSLCGACPPWMSLPITGLLCASAAGVTLLRWLVPTCFCPAPCCCPAAGAAGGEPGAAPRARIQC